LLSISYLFRYLSLSKPASYTSAKLSCMAIALIVCIWILVAASNIPLFVWTDVVSFGNSSSLVRHRCIVTESDPQIQTAYILASRVINYWIPIGVVWICNILIIHRIRSSMKKVLSSIEFSFCHVPVLIVEEVEARQVHYIIKL
jgi:7 transmembrane receptor (rhodopsin family)